MGEERDMGGCVRGWPLGNSAIPKRNLTTYSFPLVLPVCESETLVCLCVCAGSQGVDFWICHCSVVQLRMETSGFHVLRTSRSGIRTGAT